VFCFRWLQVDFPPSIKGTDHGFNSAATVQNGLSRGEVRLPNWGLLKNS
jgi:hypothetical protein